MVDENRFQRLEDKVDDVKEEVGEMKLEARQEFTELKFTVENYMEKVEEHVAGDKKIIDKLTPVLDKLPTIVEMAEKHHFQKKFRKKVYKGIGVLATLVGIAAGISRML